MATPTLTNVPTTISNADTVTGWTTFTTLDPDIKKEGSNAVSGILRNDLATGAYTGTSTSMTNQHIRVWVSFAAIGYLDIEANNGMEFYVSDGTNTAYWVVFGSDTYSGGWKNVIVDYSSTPDSGTKPAGNVTTWGLRFNRTAAPRQVINTWVDYLRYGDGYTITGGTSGDKVRLTNIYAVDGPAAYGIVDRIEGVYFAYGKLTFGNGATTTHFEMDSDVLIFTDSPVSSTLYAIIGTGSGCNINIKDSVIKAAGTGTLNRFLFDMDDVNLASFNMTGSSIVRAHTVYFKSACTVDNTTFLTCGTIYPQGATITNSNFVAATDTAGGVVFASPSDCANMSYCNFTDNAKAIKITTAGNYYFVGHQFSGNTVQVDFTGTGTCNIYPSAGCNVLQSSCTASGGGTIIVNTPQVNLTFTGVKSGSEVRIIRVSDGVELGGIETTSGTSWIWTHAYGGTEVNIYILHLNYQWYAIRNLSLSSSDSSIPVSQILDRQYDPGSV